MHAWYSPCWLALDNGQGVLVSRLQESVGYDSILTWKKMYVAPKFLL
jgi:hypothetical protein